ncbi:hypothetical protein [Nocardia sp. NPDC058666]|uniref:hypothetical protein n=1 Tax=Nocardia sp. NPDC058666 TaxID=3346587 RepID=UPI0036561DCF
MKNNISLALRVITFIFVAVALVLGGVPAIANAAVHAYPGMQISTDTSTCTAGMVGHIGSARYVVTAAHCYKPGERVYDSVGNGIGWYEAAYGNDDTVEEEGFALVRLWNNVTPTASMGKFGISSIDELPPQGAAVCKIGATSNWSCGSVTRASTSDRVMSDLEALPGDSGGVVYRGTADGQAAFVGIVLGTTVLGETVVEPAEKIQRLINSYGPTASNEFRWYVTK